MLWLGLTGRRKIASLEAELSALKDDLQKLGQAFRTLDLEMSSHLDRLNGIAKRFSGRKGGRPPAAQPNGEAEGDAEPDAVPAGPLGFNRHVL
jgi:hypothetical protein